MSGLPPRRQRLAQRTLPQDDDVVEVFIDAGDEPGFSHAEWHHADAPNATAAEEVTLEQLINEVEAAKREVTHLWFLLLRAVWHAIVQQRRHTPQRDEHLFTTRQASRSAPFLTAEERRAQLRAASAKSRRNQSMSLVHDVSTCHTSHNTSGQKPPFLPPAKHPVMPTLNPDELQRIHRHLYKAITDTTADGALLTSGYTLPGHGNKTSSSALQRSRQSMMVPASSSRTSFRSAALKLTADTLPAEFKPSCPRGPSSVGSATTSRSVTPPSSVSPRLPPNAHSRQPSLEPHESPPFKSVSMLILQVASRRARATLYLRQLRLNVYIQHVRQAEVELRFRYYLQRRMLRQWCAAASIQATESKHALRVCVQVWQETVRERQAMRETLHRFTQGVRLRAALYAEHVLARKRRLWRRWQDAFTYQRVEHALAATADAFHQSRARPLPRYFSVQDPPARHRGGGQAGALALSAVTDRYRLRCFFQTWRAKFQTRARLRAADEVHSRAQLRHVWQKLRAVAVDALQRRQANPQTPAALTEDVLSRCLIVHVYRPERASALRAYKDACARRVSQSMLLRRTFGRWQCRYEDRVAHRFRTTHLRLTVLRTWLRATTRHQAHQATRRALWQRWRCRFAARLVGRQAFSVIHQPHVQRAVFVHWHHLTQALQLNAWQRSRFCLRHWWERTALRAAVPVMERSKRDGLFRYWHHRAAQARQRRLMLALADTLRETALLLGCVRLWNSRFTDRRHRLAATAIVEELRIERQRQRLFSRWKQRTFGSTEPFPL